MRRLLAVAAALLVAGCLWHPPFAPYAALVLSPSPPQPDRLTARFMGVGTVLIDDGTIAIMSDGFFTRPGKLQTALGPIAPDEERIAYALDRAGIRKLAAVVVAHSHHDHAMDAPRVARLTDARLIGTQSTANIALGEDFPESRIDRLSGARHDFGHGAFTVVAVRSPHTADPLFFEGEIPRPLKPPVWVGAYKEGGNYSFLLQHRRGNVLIHASTNAQPGMYAGLKADVVFLGIATLVNQPAGARFIEAYWRDVVLATGAKLVIPVHWDDFTLPLDEPLKPFPVAIDSFEAAMAWVAHLGQRDGIAIRFMPLFEPVDVMAVLGR